MLDLATIRERNKGQPDGYWKATTAALDNIRRMLDDGVPVPPWLVRGLVEQAACWRGQASNWADNIAALTKERDYLRAAVERWADAIERCDGIVAAEEALREVVRGLRS